MKLYTENNSEIILCQQHIGKGGEGLIYKLDASSKFVGKQNHVAKIYLNNGTQHCNKEKLQCLRDMFVNSNVKGISYPKELLYDSSGNCVGFLMTEYAGNSLHQMTFIPKIVKESHWSRIELATLSINLLKKFVTLHNMGILMADVNPFNILIPNNLLPIFIDVDSYQIGEKYPCTVCTREYLSPRIIDTKDFSNKFREIEDEYYAITVLLFKIFLVGRNPYAGSKVGSLETNMRKREFVFPEGYNDTSDIPRGPYQRIWYNLPYNMRRAFYQAFRKDNYLSPLEWKEIIEEYLECLKEGRYPRIIFPDSNNKSLKKSILELQPRHLNQNKTPLRQFTNTIIESEKKNYSFVEFGTNTIRGFELRDGVRPAMTVLKSNYFSCVDDEGLMNIEQFTNQLHLSFESWNRWFSYIKGFNPKITHLYAFGSTLMRNIKNRERVIEAVKKEFGITFGIISAQEEAIALAINCYNVNPISNLVAINVDGVSMFVVAKKKGEKQPRYWEFGDLSSKILCNWLFGTAHVDTQLETKLKDHDLSIDSKIKDICITEKDIKIFGYGTIQELLGNARQKNIKQLSISQLKEKRKELTAEIICNRIKVTDLHYDITNNSNGNLSRKLELRLGISVYIGLMEKLNIKELNIMPFGVGESYINYFLNSSK